MKPHYQIRTSKPLDFTVEQWRVLTPEAKSLKLHLSPDVYIEFCDIRDSLSAPYDPFAELTDPDMPSAEALKMFVRTVRPQVSKERTVMALEGENGITAFYELNVIDENIEFFRTTALVAHEIKVFVRDKQVMPEELDDDYHDQFLEIAGQFGIEYCMAYDPNKDLFVEVQNAYVRKERRLQPLSKEQLYTIPLRRSGIAKALSMSAVGVAVMSFLVLAGGWLAKSDDWRMKGLGSLVVGIASVAGIVFKQQAAVAAEHAYSNPILADSGDEVHYAA